MTVKKKKSLLHSRSITGSSTVAITSASPKRSGLGVGVGGGVGGEGEELSTRRGFEISP